MWPPEMYNYPCALQYISIPQPLQEAYTSSYQCIGSVEIHGKSILCYQAPWEENQSKTEAKRLMITHTSPFKLPSLCFNVSSSIYSKEKE